MIGKCKVCKASSQLLDFNGSLVCAACFKDEILLIMEPIPR